MWEMVTALTTNSRSFNSIFIGCIAKYTIKTIHEINQPYLLWVILKFANNRYRVPRLHMYRRGCDKQMRQFTFTITYSHKNGPQLSDFTTTFSIIYSESFVSIGKTVFFRHRPTNLTHRFLLAMAKILSGRHLENLPIVFGSRFK